MEGLIPLLQKLGTQEKLSIINGTRNRVTKVMNRGTKEQCICSEEVRRDGGNVSKILNHESRKSVGNVEIRCNVKKQRHNHAFKHTEVTAR